MNKIPIPATRQIDLKNISDRSQTPKDCMLYDSIYVKYSEKINLNKQYLKK